MKGMKILALMLSFVLVLSLVPAAAAETITETDILDLLEAITVLFYEKSRVQDMLAFDELYEQYGWRIVRCCLNIT